LNLLLLLDDVVFVRTAAAAAAAKEGETQYEIADRSQSHILSVQEKAQK
jgi:hypothetical protein